ncbi:helix-turn-helix domain-containing protein [Anaerosinus massiliensis]|uniref:helix-turn-helix domain-containing protein n=1 Tax=Massilibacillus massiliensis TaxID=1806837 RepID=UPI000AC737F1|nr:helix-turn-helix domain-containing protein [Massilibacillus massiliensis]
MAKGKYEQWLTEEGLIKIQGWAHDGLTDEQIATNMGIKRQTLYEWIKKYPVISDTLKKGKEIVDRQVENALLQKALGFKEIVTRAIKVKEVLYDNGKRISEKEHIEYADDEVFVPPETTAQIFWLKNRKPDVWRDKKDVAMSGEINNPYAGLTTDELKKLVRGNDG